MVRLGRAVAVTLGVTAALAAVCWRDVRFVAAMDRTAPFAAQTNTSGAPTIQVYSRETVVDVTVIDKDGKPVHGLKQSDFTVQEDGKPEPIRSFAEFGADGGAVVTQSIEKLPPHVYSNRRTVASTGAVNIIVMDAVNTGPMNQMRAKKEATAYLRRMPEGTPVALLALGNELKFVQGFTTDREVLIAALNDMKNTVMTPGSVNTPPCYAKIVKPRMTLEALRQIGAMVQGIKGKKNVLWFTGDMDVNPSPLADCPPDILPVERTKDMLTAGQVTVYTIDASGFKNPLAPLSAEFGAGTPPMMQPTSAYGGGLVDGMAGATGGRAFRGTNDIMGSMAKAIELGSNYYTLTYVPAHGNDENYHHITVKVNRPGLSLMYRPGYGADDLTKAKAESRIPTTLNTTTPDPEKNTMKASMARFAPPATQMLFDVKVALTETVPGPTDPQVMGFPVDAVKGKPLVRYDLLYTLPTDQIAFTDGAGGIHNGSVEFDVAASDVFGKLMTSVSRTMQFPLTDIEYREFVQTPFQFYQQIDLPPGQIYVRIGVLDKVSNKVGTIEIPLTVAKGPGVVTAGR